MSAESAMKLCVEEVDLVKCEVEVKREEAECGVCGGPGLGPAADGGLLLRRLLPAQLQAAAGPSSAGLCAPCRRLLDQLAQAEAEYLRLKDAFDAIIARNPLYCSPEDANIKQEVEDVACDSEDEPLAKKKNKKCPTRKKKKTRTKSSANDNWECSECGLSGSGGPEALVAHNVLVHNDLKTDERLEVKNESDFVLTMEFEEDFDDNSNNSSEFIVPELVRKKRGRTPGTKVPAKTRMKRDKQLHQCNECDAKYTSLKRLQLHLGKHSAGKPPYICEVCGARYKHKKACDIHVALHNGISDWKCEECNKLFPSKGALQRHNNIHTGKLNYQCDLCGKSFIHTSSFKMHKLSHSGLKPHSCDVCGLALMTRSHLKRHKRVHSGEKSHECRVCGKRFSERYNLAAHAKSHEEALVASEPAPRRRLFRCAFCPERFERRYMLERHTSVAHGRTLERLPATPRNTMSKLLKMQALARGTHGMDTKQEKSPDTRSPDIVPLKVQLSASGAGSVGSVGAGAGAGGAGAGSWSGAYLEFGLRPDYAN